MVFCCGKGLDLHASASVTGAGLNGPGMEFVEFPFGSGQYDKMLVLRDEMLRKPLGLEVYAEATEAEAGYRHFGMEAGGRMVACLMCVPLAEGIVKIRQMAVHSDYQGTGLGRQLMEAVEALLRDEGTPKLTLNARHTAIGFYEKLGYHPVGEQFTEVGIPHQRMEKLLQRMP